MSTEARKVMTMSMVKITTSRQRKSGINLRQNLLVANVMLSARSVFMSATTPKKRELKRQRRITMLKPNISINKSSTTTMETQPSPPKLARMNSVTVPCAGDGDAVVPDMDSEQSDDHSDPAEQDNMSSDEQPAIEVAKSHKRLHCELEDGELEDCDDDDLHQVQEPLRKQPNHHCPRDLTSLVNRFNGLLEGDSTDNDLSCEEEDEEPTTDGFISNCSSKVIEYDMSARAIQLEV